MLPFRAAVGGEPGGRGAMEPGSAVGQTRNDSNHRNLAFVGLPWEAVLSGGLANPFVFSRWVDLSLVLVCRELRRR